MNEKKFQPIALPMNREESARYGNIRQALMDPPKGYADYGIARGYGVEIPNQGFVTLAQQAVKDKQGGPLTGGQFNGIQGGVPSDGMQNDPNTGGQPSDGGIAAAVAQMKQRMMSQPMMQQPGMQQQPMPQPMQQRAMDKRGLGRLMAGLAPNMMMRG